MTTIIAIDPGKSGGIAVLHQNHVAAYPMPDTDGDLLELIKGISLEASRESAKVVCVLEQVGGFIGKAQPGAAMFRFGESYGFIKGLMMALTIKLELVRPQTWQKSFSLGTASACASKTEWKNKLKAEAQRRFPSLGVTLKTADALLILEWYQRNFPH
jgi:hypothetical protein